MPNDDQSHSSRDGTIERRASAEKTKSKKNIGKAENRTSTRVRSTDRPTDKPIVDSDSSSRSSRSSWDKMDWQWEIELYRIVKINSSVDYTSTIRTFFLFFIRMFGVRSQHESRVRIVAIYLFIRIDCVRCCGPKYQMTFLPFAVRWCFFRVALVVCRYSVVVFRHSIVSSKFMQYKCVLSILCYVRSTAL